MAPIDEWLTAWLVGGVSPKHGAYRSPGPLHVYAMTANSEGAEFSGPLPAWPDLAERLREQRVQLGLIAVEVPVDHAYFKYPGVTLAFDGPLGGSQVACEVMDRLARLGVGGVLAGTEKNGRFGVLRIIMTPRWYAKTGDQLFGVEWAKVPNDPVHCDEAKKAWALGIHAALGSVLADIPATFLDTIKFGAFDVVDWLHDLSPRETSYLYEAKPWQVADALYQMGSFELEELSSLEPRPYGQGEILQTIYDDLEDEATFAWLLDELRSPDCLLLHARGRAAAYCTEFIFCLLRRQRDGRVRLTIVRFAPAEQGTRQDYFEVNPEFFVWPEHADRPAEGAEVVLKDFIKRYGDTFEAGTLHVPSALIAQESYREVISDWLRRSPSSAIDYEMLSDLRLRVHALLRQGFQDDPEERELSVSEAEELFGWLHETGQQWVEMDWLLTEWEREWRAYGLEPDELEKFLRSF